MGNKKQVVIKDLSKKNELEISDAILKYAPSEIVALVQGLDIKRPMQYGLARLFTPSNTLIRDDGRRPYYASFIDNAFEAAKRDPNSKSADWIRQLIFSSQVDSLFNESEEDKKEFAIFKLRKTLFDKQIEVFDDESAGEHLVIAGRRGGKSNVNARKIIKSILTPQSHVLYLNKTFENAINQLWDLCFECCKIAGIEPIDGTTKSGGFIIFANGSSIQFGGINNIAAIDKYRGYKYNLIIVDEVSHLTHQNYLISEVLQPSTMDYTDAQIWYTGTPPRMQNYVSKLWRSSIKKYHWTGKDNPYIPDFDGFVAKVCLDKGVDTSAPFIQREYFGNMEAYDTDALVCRGYTITKKKGTPTRILIGVDFGFEDDNAIVTVALDDVKKTGWVLEEWSKNHVGVSNLITEIQRRYVSAFSILSEIYSEEYTNTHLAIITDTNEPMIAEDLRNIYKLPVLKAYKYDLELSIHSMVDAMRSGRLTIPSGGILEHECQNTVWERNDEDEIIYTIDDTIFHPNALHALRYVWRMASLYWKEGGHLIPRDDTLPIGFDSKEDIIKTIQAKTEKTDEEVFEV